MKGKKIKGEVKIQLVAGKANPSPPVGPALGKYGVNIMEFCKAFNSQTASMGTLVIPVLITVYEDRSFEFILKSPPASVLIKSEIGIDKGSSNSLNNKVGTINQVQLEKIAKAKMQDLNAYSLEQAVKIIKGTARSMGVVVSD